MRYFKAMVTAAAVALNGCGSSGEDNDLPDTAEPVDCSGQYPNPQPVGRDAVIKDVRSGCKPSDYKGVETPFTGGSNGKFKVLYERCGKDVSMTLEVQVPSNLHAAAGMQEGSIARINPESFELVFGKDGVFEGTVHLLGTTASTPVLKVARQALQEAEGSAELDGDNTHPDGAKALAAAKTALDMVNCRLKPAAP